MLRRRWVLLPLALPVLIGGCGIFVPDIELSSEPNANAFLTNRIVNHVKCELRDAVFNAIDYDIQNAAIQPDHKRRIPWFDSWSATVTLKFAVDEKGSFNPGVTYTQTFPKSESFSIGAGGVLSSQATRVEKVDYFFVFKDDFLNKRNEFANRPRHCIEQGGILIDSDLKIQDWLWSKLFPYFLPENIHDSPPKTLSDEITFVVISSGTVTPTWKLVRVTATGSPLFSAGRTRTDDLIITLGPVDPKTKTASKAVQDSHLASQIQSAVVQGLQRTP